MYFPYLRCKQFDLLALRELSERLGHSGKISPVLEPVKKSSPTLPRALDALMAADVNFTLIINPVVGDCVNDSSGIVSIINSKLGNYKNFQIGVIINQSTDLDKVDDLLDQLNCSKGLSLMHLGRPTDVDSFLLWAGDKEVKYNFYSEIIPVRRYRGLVTSETKVILEDKFNNKSKNADYLHTPDEFFSDEHKYFEDDGNIGFSDYLTIGADYADGGFLPYAVAIHLTYINDSDDTIRIRHFVSDSNRDVVDVAGKFGEALEKLVAFIDEKNLQTNAANEFREHYRNGHYPGLGSLKKLSIKNHLELLLQLLG
ncbi:sce7725 family protein [Arcticibacter tournemirensis]